MKMSFLLVSTKFKGDALLINESTVKQKWMYMVTNIFCKETKKKEEFEVKRMTAS